jgi:hypothetical protein
LLNNAHIDSIPIPLISFLTKFLKKGSFIPNKFLTNYEINRIDYDNYGAFLELDLAQISMISSMYIFQKIFIGKIML